jgi:hypothetical protein
MSAGYRLAAAVRQPAEASERQRKEVGLPEVGVESCAQVPDFASVNLIAQRKYPRSYPQRPWGYTVPLAQWPEQPGAVNESLIRRLGFAAKSSFWITGPRSGL